MTALIFLMLGVAMMLAIAGQREIAIGLFGISFIAAALWLNHHMVDPLKLAF